MASENVPSPVHASRPMKTSEPTPGGQQAGDQHELHHGPAQPGGLHQQEGPGQRGAEQGADGGEAARRRDHGLGPGRGVPLGQPDGDDAEPAAESDQRRLGAEDHAQAQGREGGEHDAGKLDRARRARRPP